MDTMTAEKTRAGTTTWQIDPQHSEVGFEVAHMMFAKVRGRFDDFAGKITLGAEGAIEDSRVDAEVQIASATSTCDRLTSSTSRASPR
jgi:polyisoprenoid-binding protein YceI